jgi:hypothetical protein
MLTAIVGLVAALLGVFLGQLLSAVREHREWVNEQKRLEYRQLIDQLYETMTIVVGLRPGLREENMPTISEAVSNLHRLLLDRLFIAEKLKNSGVIEDFLVLKKVILYEARFESETPRELHYSTFNVMQRENQLREKILEIVTTDIVKLNFFGMPIDE